MAGRVHAEHRYMLNSDGRTMGVCTTVWSLVGRQDFVE